MSQETKKVLEMLPPVRSPPTMRKSFWRNWRRAAPPRPPPARSEEVAGVAPKPRFLRVVVDSPDRDQVNVRVPLAILRTGIKLLGRASTQSQ